MSTRWHRGGRDRPDPYLDWEFQTRRKDGESWCCVQIELIPVNDDYSQALGRLDEAVKRGRQLDDDTPSQITITMAVEERDLLARRIKAGGKIEDVVEVQFFIYRWEPYIYRDGTYRNSPFYNVIFSGPPIAGLHFNDLTKPASTLSFSRRLASAAVAIGVVDDGIALAHERFRKAQNTHIEAIWLQQTERRGDPENGVLFGQRLDHKDINQLLKTSSSEDGIYRRIGITDFRNNSYNPLASRATHGTHLLDLAAGNETDRPILAVQLPSTATIDTSGVTMGSYVIQAVRMIMTWADQLDREPRKGIPLVINFSYGLLAGPKDGTQLLEVALANLVRYRNRFVAPTYLVLPSGNSYRTRASAEMTLATGDTQDLDWVVLPDDATSNFLEIWLDGATGTPKHCSVHLSLAPPGPNPAITIQPDSGGLNELLGNDGRPIAGIYYDVVKHGTHVRERILLAINPTVRNDDSRDIAPSGHWNVSIHNPSKQQIIAHLYIQRDDTPFGYPRRGRQSYFDHARAYERDPKTGDFRLQADDCPIIYRDTLSSIATYSPADADHVLVVGAAEATDHYPPADYSSSGPTMARKEPDCAAFADEGDAHWGILAAGTFSGSTVAMRGTSVAAPQVVRQIADQLASRAPVVPNGTPVDVANKLRLGEVVVPLSTTCPVRRRYPV